MRWSAITFCLSFCGCGLIEEDNPMAPRLGSLPPWHMWGNQLQVDLVATGAPFDISSPQLVNINYGRPDTWNFTLWQQIVACSNPGGVGVVQARFNLTVGIGRTKFTIEDFVTFIDATLPIVGSTAYTTTALDFQATPRLVTEIGAQDIILNCNTIITGGAAPGTTVSMIVGAMFTPVTHVRPDWFVDEFADGELGAK